MKIVVASLGRAHLLDCARELQRQGNNVLFYSATPKKNLVRYGMQKNGYSLLYFALPFYLLRRLFPCSLFLNLYRYVLDILVYCLMPKCDVFIAQSPNFRLSMKKAKRKYNAIAILDRGSSHVRTSNGLCLLYKGKQSSVYYQNFDEKEYYLADYIAVASSFVLETFTINSIPKKKLFLNPYGVSFLDFYPTVCTNEFDFIYVGVWNRRKGCRLIVDAFSDTSLRVLHVGSIDDTFPSLPNFVHIDPVPEVHLVDYYKRAKVFLFPSFDDGYGLVLNQAAVCGLPIVCSKHCGGPTLKLMLKNTNFIYVMEDLNKSELVKGGQIALQLTERQNGIRTYLGVENELKQLTWESYGKRYDDFLSKIFK